MNAVPKLHNFRSTRDAYDACQCDDNIKNGDILIVESEEVIGLAGTWPVAVTVNAGGLHTPKPDGDRDRLLSDYGGALALQMATFEADNRGYAVADFFKI